MKYLAGEPDAWDESVDPPIQNRELPPDQEKIKKESAAEEVSFAVSYEEEGNQSEKDNRGSDINIHAAPAVREQERDSIFSRQVPGVPEHRIWNTIAPPNRVSFSDPPINLARPLYGREPLNRRRQSRNQRYTSQRQERDDPCPPRRLLPISKKREKRVEKEQQSCVHRRHMMSGKKRKSETGSAPQAPAQASSGCFLQQSPAEKQQDQRDPDKAAQDGYKSTNLDGLSPEGKRNPGCGGAPGGDREGAGQQISKTARQKIVQYQERLEPFEIDSAATRRKQHEKPIQRIEDTGLEFTQVGLARINIGIPK